MVVPSLPLELINVIGVFLGRVELCNLSLTCRAYREVLTSLLFKNVQVDDEHLGKATEMSEVIRGAVRHVTLRHLEGVSQTDSNVYHDLGLFPSLESLYVAIRDREESRYTHAIAYGLFGYTNVLKDLRQVVEFLAHNALSLEHVTLHLESYYFSEHVSLLGLSSLPPLKSFRVHIDVMEVQVLGIPYTDFLFSSLAKSGHSLTSLYWDNPIDMEDMSGLAPIVALMPHLSELTLSGSAICIRDSTEVDLLFHQFKPLEELRILRLNCLVDMNAEPATLTDLLPLAVENLSKSCRKLETCYWDAQYTAELSFRFDIVPRGLTRTVRKQKHLWIDAFVHDTFPQRPQLCS
ncbi:hypothetical protein ONZ45_g16834 [Pleurotus djamor]|nr:hypothetical protein ONZ45_g16834 [Pleurotus djamor]